jgi:hypothetical protein
MHLGGEIFAAQWCLLVVVNALVVNAQADGLPAVTLSGETVVKLSQLGCCQRIRFPPNELYRPLWRKV